MTTTFLFTDIEGSTLQWEQSATMHDLVERHFAALRLRIGEGGGTVFATMGDGVAAAFPSADAAVHAALAAQRAMRSLGLSVRMGLHTGEAQHVDGDYRGRPVNRAARVMALGRGGQILVSDVTAALVRSAPNPIALADLGPYHLRGVETRERIWQVDDPDLVMTPPRRGPAADGELPRPRASIIGRESDVDTIERHLAEHAVVTLTGIGGVGKTRLAVHVATESAAGLACARFVDLTAVRADEDVVAAIARALGGTPITDGLASCVVELGREPTLLVLDNCEQVVAGAAAAVDALTRACPDLTVLATSREPLDIEGERVVPVRPLHSGSSAVQLFRARAAAAGADLTGTDDGIVTELCRRLDGLPLAIELAAARVASLGVPAILGSLERSLDLEGSSRSAQERHRTMRRTIDWSYQLLDVVSQDLMAWLAVFPSGFPLDAACHMAAQLGLTQEQAVDRIAGLERRSMLSAEADDIGAVRYRMLETVRAFALERLDLADQRRRAMDGLAEWVASFTDLPYRACCSADVERAALRLDREAGAWHDAIRWAATSGGADLAARLCGPPVAYFLLGRHDAADLLHPLLEQCVTPPQRRAVLSALIVSASGASAPADLEQWLAELDDIEDVEPTGLVGLMRWIALAWRGDFAESVQLCVAHSNDDRLHQATRDLFVGIAVLDHFSLTDATGDEHGLVSLALDTADRSQVALTRAACLLGAAWGIADTDPERSLGLARRALVDIPGIPGITGRTMPGSASRLLAQLDPVIAAQGLLEQLDALPQRRTFNALIPLFYAASLLERVGHPSAGAVTSVLAGWPSAPTLSMMDTLELARRAAAPGRAPQIADLEATVRIALSEVATRSEARATAAEASDQVTTSG